MILQRFGLYLIRKRSNAIPVVLLFSFLPFLQIPTLSIAAIVVGFITLHRGAKEGFIVACWALLPSIAISFYAGLEVFLLEGLGKIIIVYLLATLLGYTNRWSITLQAGVLCGVVIVSVSHLAVPDLNVWWLQRLVFLASQLQSMGNLNFSPDELRSLAEQLSYFATGVVVAAILSFDIVLMLVARAWQALLFNPGGLRQEWYRLRMSYLYAGITLVILLGYWLRINWLMDILPIVLMPFLLAGLSLLHAVLPQKASVRMPILILTYLGLLFFSLYVGVMLMLAAFIDSWFDFRNLRHMTH